MPQQLAGVFPVLPTIFDEDGEIDRNGFTRVIEFVIAAGADGVVFPGLASEYDQLTVEERCRLVALAGEVTAGRVAFVVGASGGSIEESRALTEAGRTAGAAAAMVMTPGQLGGDIKAITSFYAELGATGLPIMLQNAPAPMGSNLAAADVLRIVASVPEIAWVKEENMPCGQRITALINAGAGALQGVFGGAGGRYVTDELARGALGTMPAAELPEAHVALYAAFRAGDDARMRATYEAMLPLLMMQAVFRWDLTKEVLKRRGLIKNGYVRAPGPRLDAGDRRELDRVLDRVDSLLAAARV